MNNPQDVNPAEVKSSSEAAVVQAGGRICDWLPLIEHTNPRDVSEVIDRALIINALIQLYFGAPSPIILDWIERESLGGALTAKEKILLSKPTGSLTDQERADLYWSIEALWAILWATSLIDGMPFDRRVEDFMASLCPNLRHNEGGEKFRQNMQLRSYAELYAMRDQAFRFHWWTRDAQLKGEQTGNVVLDIVMERRKALEWILDRESDWDNMPLNT